MNNPFCDPYLILNKVYIGGKFLKQAIAETPVEPFNKARTVKICYGVLEKDIYLDWIISSNTEKPPKTSVKIILKTALYMLEFMQKHNYMVVDEAVTLAKKLGKSGAAGFINAFLRSYKVPPLPENPTQRLSVESSAPLWLVKKLKRSYKEEAKDILCAPSQGICVQFERNAERYLNILHADMPFENVYIFNNFVRDENFFAGDYTFRSIGSTAVCSAISAGETLLDACAAPGGKSVFLSRKFKQITACELHPHRVELIKAYASRMGVENVTAVQADSGIFNPAYENAFDAVLCDVPCSGTGVINENPDIKLFRKEEDIAALQQIQLKILENCSRYVKKGGTLYYSTCSVLPEENDTAACTFLKLHPEYALFIPVSPLKNRQTNYGLQFLPHISMGAGFYLTSFKKL